MRNMGSIVVVGGGIAGLVVVVVVVICIVCIVHCNVC